MWDQTFAEAKTGMLGILVPERLDKLRAFRHKVYDYMKGYPSLHPWYRCTSVYESCIEVSLNNTSFGESSPSVKKRFYGGLALGDFR